MKSFQQAQAQGKPILIASSSRMTFWPWMKSKYGYTDDQLRPYTFNLQPFFADLLRDVYEGLGIEATYAETTTYCGLFGGVAIYVLVVVINQRRRRHQQRSRI